jgi:hypothetical protein
MSVDKKSQARHLFFDGMTLIKAAEVVGVHRSSTERWSREEGWFEQRELRNSELKDKFIRENFNLYYANALELADSAYRLMADALAERHLLKSGKLAKRNLRISNQMFTSISKTYTSLEKMIGELKTYRNPAKSG